jgi:diguanylate cyclase (GGDEF)-like protein
MEMQLEETLQSTLQSYRAALGAVGDAGVQACPPAGENLKESLLNLQLRLTAEASASVVGETEQRLEEELRTWSERAGRYYQEKTEEVKEVLLIVAKAAGQVGERDQRYAKQFGDLTERLQAAAKLNDISSIRQSLQRSVTDIKACVTRMAEDGQASVAQLRTQLATYEARLEEVERIASLDSLTGIANRRKVERQLDLRVSKGSPFSVIYLDLNRFKHINDSLGHSAGDDVLKQFAGELRAAFRSTDVVGRWGGDEFIVVVDAGYRDAKARVERIDQWVNGEYTVIVGKTPQKVNVTTAVGIATWNAGETVAELLQRADAAMYQSKSAIDSATSADA